jgi:O-antigen/teichoic acid export membrane protein
LTTKLDIAADDIPASDDSDAAPRPSMRRLALRGSMWILFGYGGGLVLRIASNLILTRLLFPEAFGISAIVGLFQAGLEMFSDIGVGPNIIRSRRGDDPDFLDTAWTIQVGRGLLLCLGSMAIAWPASRMYHTPQLVWLLPIAGISPLIRGFTSTGIFTCTRRLRLGHLMALELSTQVVSLVTTIGLAIAFPSPWALVVGGLAGSLSRTVFSHMLPGAIRHRFRREPEALADLFGFGRWIALNSLITFLAMQSDRLLLGRLVSMELLGLYTIALSLAQLPRDLLARFDHNLLLPAVSEAIRSGQGVGKARGIRRTILFAASVGCMALAAIGPPLIHSMYDRRYESAGPLLAILAIGTWMQIVQSSYFSTVLMAAGTPKFITAGLSLRLIIIVGLAGPCFSRFGMAGIAGLTVVGEAAFMLVCATGVARSGQAPIRLDVRDCTIGLLLGLISFSVVRLVILAPVHVSGLLFVLAAIASALILMSRTRDTSPRLSSLVGRFLDD